MQQRRGLHRRLGTIGLLERSCDQRVNRQRVNMSLERAPARKLVAPGELELRVGEPRRRVRFTQLFEEALGLFTQPVEVGMFREVHDAPSFLREGSLSAARVRGRARNEGSWRPTTGRVS